MKASPTVVPAPSPLKLRPATSSYVVMPVIVTPKTRAVATNGRLHPLARARWTVPSVNSPGATAGVRRACAPEPGLGCTLTTRICSPVRLKKCWKTDPPLVAMTLTTPAPRIVP
ncbi:hypothetical protein ACGFS9_00565 [Streptomyces sp. NPDC048566]|uniref:hypothetical protein n=1 Tax=Streptomyces sp. NPDC048566 TaxID=3365569 RepID=UPI0037157FBD